MEELLTESLGKQAAFHFEFEPKFIYLFTQLIFQFHTTSSAQFRSRCSRHSPSRQLNVIILLSCLKFNSDFWCNFVFSLFDPLLLVSHRGRTGTCCRRSNTDSGRSFCIAWFCSYDECESWRWARAHRGRKYIRRQICILKFPRIGRFQF